LKQEWIERPEGGGRAGFATIFAIARLFGRRISRWTLYPIVLYFLARRGPERRASRTFLTRALQRPANLADVARHFHSFAAITLDRVYLLKENLRRFDVECEGLDELRAMMARGRGVLLFGAHLGSFDALRALSAQKGDVPIRVIIDVEQNPSLSRLLNALNPNLAATIINARGDGAQTALAIKEALDERALVTMLVDRARPGNRVTSANFLGTPASFPNEPWLLAAALQVPVVLCFGLYRGGNRYVLHFELFAEHLNMPRQARETALQAILQRYADRLAHYVRRAPNNWFNFYDFWQSKDSNSDSDRTTNQRGRSVRGAVDSGVGG
jgi:predicted LPLAT superfamily acyltransferase